jgi:hypothetical protein
MKHCAVLAAWAAAACFAASPLAAQGPDAVRIGLVQWPAETGETLNTLGNELEDCLTARLREVAPEIVVIPQRTIRDALFPLLEPSTQPQNEAEFAALLARPAVRERLVERGLRYLVAYTGGTRHAPSKGGILCGAGMGGGGCLGFSWRGEATALDAALWSLDASAPLRHERAAVEGTFMMPAFVVPIPIPARTEARACQELGTRIAEAIRQSTAATPPAR